jgi:hypothetical protein
LKRALGEENMEGGEVEEGEEEEGWEGRGELEG